MDHGLAEECHGRGVGVRFGPVQHHAPLPLGAPGTLGSASQSLVPFTQSVLYQRRLMSDFFNLD